MAIVKFACCNREEALIPVLSHQQYEVLHDIGLVLSVAHSAQELLSAEKTPTLSLAFPVYKSVADTLLELGQKIPELASAIGLGIAKICKYIDHTKDAWVNTLAMVINPAIKFEFINLCWKAYDQSCAYKIVQEVMLKFQCKRYTQAIAQSHPGAGTAAHAQNVGYLSPTPAKIQSRNLGAVEFELNQYISQGTIPINLTGAIDLVEYWRVSIAMTAS
ncbi:hypothetical protein RhiTH_009814 [Rhizoctonia solani]